MEYLTGLIRFLLVWGCLVPTPCIYAWSSTKAPFFQEVHQMAIENVLAANTNATREYRLILETQQSVVDQDQQATNSFEHSMTGLTKPGDTLQAQKPIYIREAEAFIRDHLVAAIQAKHNQAYLLAYTNLGRAIHPLQDATSPAHAPFQPWSYKESLWAKAMHCLKENRYPDDKSNPIETRQRNTLEGAVRWAYDIYLEKAALPAAFFDAGGNLQLPSSYGSP